MYAWFSALILQNIWVIWLQRHGIAESTVTKTYSNMKVRSVTKHRVPLRNHRTKWGIVQQAMFMIGWFILVIVQKRRFYNVLYGFFMFYHSLAWFIPMHCVHGSIQIVGSEWLSQTRGPAYLATENMLVIRGVRRPQTWKHVCDFANDAGQPRWPNRGWNRWKSPFFFQGYNRFGCWPEEKEHKKHSRGLAGKILALKTLWI